MRFALTKQHLDFYYKNHFIECEELISISQLQSLSVAIQDLLAKRLKINSKTLQYADVKQLFIAGRDLWRDSKAIQSLVFSSRFAEISAYLTKETSIRLAYDQVFYFHPCSSKHPFFKDTHSLNQLCCLQKLTCALLIPIPFAFENIKSPGNGTFFSPQLSLSLLPVTPHHASFFLMMTYSGDKTLYTFEAKDLHTHHLKKLGYVFGDRLKHSTHPLVFPI